MAGVAIIRDGAPIGACMASIVAAEAPRKVHVAKVVGIGTPGHIHGGEHISRVHACTCRIAVIHKGAFLAIHLGIGRAIEIVQRRCDLL